MNKFKVVAITIIATALFYYIDHVSAAISHHFFNRALSSSYFITSTIINLSFVAMLLSGRRYKLVAFNEVDFILLLLFFLFAMLLESAHPPVSYKNPGAIFTLLLASPIAEELFFREWCLTRLKNADFSQISSFTITAALFSASHGIGNPEDFFRLCILGFALCYVRVVRGSIIQPIFCHAFYNLGASI